MKRKRVLKELGIALLAVIIALAAAAGALFAFYTPTVTFNASSLTGEVTNGASGFLYGIAQEGVPSRNMVKSVGLSSLSTKTTLGLQHPIGEMEDVAAAALSSGSCDYLVVYLQDMYPTWYYDHENIEEMRESGAYDWRDYVENTYFPLVRETVAAQMDSPYSDKLVYCLYNEPDNGVWFGDFSKDGSEAFFEAWRMTYQLVRSMDANAVIGGPGYFDYDSAKMRDFLEYASENGCMPDVLIYHELNYRSIYDWQFHRDDLSSILRSLGLSEDIPVIVTEYGMMEDNGNPNTMLKYISRIESSKVYAQQAYWLFANNLCSTAADYNTPNSAWWVYRWYSQLQGQTMESSVSDFFHSDVGKAIIQLRAPRYRQFMGLGTLNSSRDKIALLVSGADYDGRVRLTGLENTAFYGGSAYIEIEAVTYQGISGMVFAPEKVKGYTESCGKTLDIDMSFMDENTAYHITVRPAEEGDEPYSSETLYQRYEFENGELLGNSYTYDSAYASTGEKKGLVGGNENEGDGVRLSITVPESGSYELRLIYGKANDGAANENGVQRSEDRVSAKAIFSADGEEQTITLPNTVKSEITGAYDMLLELEAGEHTIELRHLEGTFVLDSLLIRPYEKQECAVLTDNGAADADSTAFLAVAPQDGYYDIASAPLCDIDVDGAPARTGHDGTATVYLRRGLNYITVFAQGAQLNTARRETQSLPQRISLSPGSAQLSGSARLLENEAAGVSFITGIEGGSGSARYVFTAPESGVYKLTLLYSANREQGVHDYNVDLVEDNITLSVNGAVSQLYCRNTCSADNFTTVTVNIELKEGENELLLYNDGSNSFNGTQTYAPDISEITVNKPQIY